MMKTDFRIFTLLYVGLLSTILTACDKAAKPSPDNNPTVSGLTVRFAADSQNLKRLPTAPVVAAHETVLNLPARIAWDEDHTSRVTSPVAGRLNEIRVQAGAQVKADQPLAYLTSPELGSAQTEAARAQAELAQAERNLARAKELFEANGVAGKDLEQAQLDLARARAEAERTSLRLKSWGAANLVDQRFVLRSPIAGVVVERNTNPGMEWRPDQPGAPMFVVSDPTYMWCWIDAPERALGMLRPGMKVKLRSSAWPQEMFEAQIEHVADALDAVSRTLKVRAKLRNPQRHLKAEMYVTAELTGQARGMLDVPAKAVFLNSGAQQVFVKTAAGQFTRKSIAPIAANDQWVSIAQDLKMGDEVVTDGALYLQKMLDENGMKPASKAAPAQSK